MKCSVSDLPDVVLLDEYLSQAQMAALYKSVDVMVLPRRVATRGRSAIEAMAMELPVIATEQVRSLEAANSSCMLPLDTTTSALSPKQRQAVQGEGGVFKG